MAPCVPMWKLPGTLALMDRGRAADVRDSQEGLGGLIKNESTSLAASASSEKLRIWQVWRIYDNYGFTDLSLGVYIHSFLQMWHDIIYPASKVTPQSTGGVSAYGVYSSAFDLNL